MFDIIDLYKVFAVIDIFLVIRRIVLIKKSPPGTIYYQTYLFIICAVLAFECTLPFVLVTTFGNPPILPLMDLPVEHRIMWLTFLLIDLCVTFALLIFSGKYATYHIVYYPKKKRTPKTVNIEESFIIRHKLFFSQTILVRDIIPEKSYYFKISGKESKLFPYMSIFGGEEYLVAQLKSAKDVKIQNNMIFLRGTSYSDHNELPELAKALNIEIKHSKD